MNNINSAQHFVPSSDVVTTIVIPTIVFCIGMVVAMLIGINKCKQWELDKIVEMRRTRRVIQRITARLREKNFRTIQKAQNMRKRAVVAANKSSTGGSQCTNNELAAAIIAKTDVSTFEKTMSSQRPLAVSGVRQPPPPFYCVGTSYPMGNSPPPTYEDSLLDQLYFECLPMEVHHESQCSCGSWRRSSASNLRRK